MMDGRKKVTPGVWVEGRGEYDSDAIYVRAAEPIRNKPRLDMERAYREHGDAVSGRLRMKRKAYLVAFTGAEAKEE